MDDLGSSGDPGGSGFVERLAVELRHWEREGLITGEQALAIASRYRSGGSARPSQRAHARLVSILAVFGAILVGLGIVLFFAANWDQNTQGGPSGDDHRHGSCHLFPLVLDPVQAAI